MKNGEMYDSKYFATIYHALKLEGGFGLLTPCANMIAMAGRDEKFLDALGKVSNGRYKTMLDWSLSTSPLELMEKVIHLVANEEQIEVINKQMDKLK